MREVRTSHSATCLITPTAIPDLERVLAIEEQSFSAPWTRKMFEVELTGNQFGHLWSARCLDDRGAPNRLVGYICFWVVFDEFRLMTLAVEAPWRRRGIAKAMMDQALTWAGAAGAHRALLEVRASNVAAIQLYEQTGFRTIASRERYYTNPVENALIMAMEPIR
jgi:ribosomal-protein-alanine N-acetyltransferase